MSRVSAVDALATMDLRPLLDLSGKVAVVTGASSGLGAATAGALAGAGADVALVARRTDRLCENRNRIKALGRRAVAITADVTDSADCRAMAENVRSQFGRLDILVNNAGTANGMPALREREDDFRSVVDVNLTGAFLVAQACAPFMAAGSAIVNVSSVLGLRPVHLPLASYAASKAGLLALTRELAAQWTPRLGIRVNAVAPGFVATEMTKGVTDVGRNAEPILAATPMGRFGDAREIASAVLFLASAASSFMTGSVLVVDGGLTMW